MARPSRSTGVAESWVLVRAAHQLVTLHGPAGPRRGSQMLELAVIPDGSILVRNGRIEEVGVTRRVERLKAARNAMEIDASASVVMPAFIDTAARILSDEPRRAVVMTSAATVLCGMLRHGTATVEVQNEADIRLLRICAALQGRPATLLASLIHSADPNAVTLETAARLRLVHLARVTVSDDETSAEQVSEFLASARTLRIPIAIQATAGCSGRAALLAMEWQPASIAGLEALPETTIRGLARSTSTVGCVQARLLIDEGGALVLGTRFHYRTNPDYNMPHALSLACEHLSLSPAEAITASTINAAYAAGCAERRGSLEPGKWADLVLYDCRDYRDIVRNGAVNQVSRVLRQGKTMYRRGNVEMA